MHNSAQINLNVLESLAKLVSDKVVSAKQFTIFYSSSACIYPQEIQTNSLSVDLPEYSAYPANPDSEYGWEKLFSERMYSAYARNYNLNVRIGRYHNIYGPLGTWRGGREKAPAAICRKVAEIQGNKGEVEIWGNGEQTRSFLYIDDCIDATLRLVESDWTEPVNIGSEEMVSISELCHLVSSIAEKSIQIRLVPDKPVGVAGRNSNNALIRRVLAWDYQVSLADGLKRTYEWVSRQVEQARD